MFLRTIGRTGILLFLSGALSACGSLQQPTPTVMDTSGVGAVRGVATFKVVQPNLRNSIAEVDGREVVMYWDDQTIFVRGNHAMRTTAKYWVQDTPNPGPALPGAKSTTPYPAKPGQSYFKQAQTMSDIDPPQPGETFEFRGVRTNGQIALRIVQFK